MCTVRLGSTATASPARTPAHAVATGGTDWGRWQGRRLPVGVPKTKTVTRLLGTDPSLGTEASQLREAPVDVWLNGVLNAEALPGVSPEGAGRSTPPTSVLTAAWPPRTRIPGHGLRGLFRRRADSHSRRPFAGESWWGAGMCEERIGAAERRRSGPGHRDLLYSSILTISLFVYSVPASDRKNAVCAAQSTAPVTPQIASAAPLMRIWKRLNVIQSRRRGRF